MTRFTETDNERLERERFFKGHGRGTIGAEQQRPQVGFKRLTPDATIPTKAFPTDSGFDISASADVFIEPGETVVIQTDIAVSLPAGYEAQIRPRSGVTSKTKIRIALGTIDNSYIGAIGVIADNITDDPIGNTSRYIHFIDGTERRQDEDIPDGAYLIRKGDRVAQIVITKLPDVEAVEVFDVGDSARGAKGFGSSGVSV